MLKKQRTNMTLEDQTGDTFLNNVFARSNTSNDELV